MVGGRGGGEDGKQEAKGVVLAFWLPAFSPLAVRAGLAGEPRGPAAAVVFLVPWSLCREYGVCVVG